MIEIILVLILIISIAEGIIIKRKMSQNDNYQKILETYENWIENFTLTVETIDSELDRIDAEGIFRSDDEIGFLFQSVYSILKRLSEYGLINEPEQIPVEQEENVFYAKDREIIKRIKKRRNDSIEIEDIQKKLKK